MSANGSVYVLSSPYCLALALIVSVVFRGLVKKYMPKKKEEEDVQ